MPISNVLHFHIWFNHNDNVFQPLIFFEVTSFTGCYWWPPLNHTYEHIIALRHTERNFNGEGSEVYNDMKIHKKFLYQTKPIFPEAFNSRRSHFREASGKVVLLKYFTNLKISFPSCCCHWTLWINHTYCLMKDSVWTSKVSGFVHYEEDRHVVILFVSWG